MSKLRSTPKGKEDNRARSEKLRSTDKGKEDNRKTAKEGMANLRSTDEGREANRLASEQGRAEKKAELIEKMANLRFPPDINDKIEKDCIQDFIKATSFESLQRVECGICGEAVRECRVERIYNLPYDILGADQNPNQMNLNEYEHVGLLLSPGVVENDTYVKMLYTMSQRFKQ